MIRPAILILVFSVAAALHIKSRAVIDRPYRLWLATVGALYERPLFTFCAKPVAAMAQRPAPEVRITAGWAGFLDDAPDHHVVAGGSIRYYLTPRISFEPELMYFGGDDHHDITLTPNFAFDFASGRVVPYGIGGVGWMRSDFGRFTTDDIFITGGFGAKLFLTDHIYFAPEIRTGWEPHVQLTGTFGFTF